MKAGYYYQQFHSVVGGGVITDSQYLDLISQRTTPLVLSHSVVSRSEFTAALRSLSKVDAVVVSIQIPHIWLYMFILIAKLRNKTTILLIHNPWFMEEVTNSIFPKKSVRAWYWLLQQFLFLFSNKGIVFSMYQHDQLKKAFTMLPKLHVVQPALSKKNTRSVPKQLSFLENVPYVTMIARLEKRKQWGIALRAYAQSLSETHLFVVGCPINRPGNSLEELKTIADVIDEYSLSGKVIILPNVTQTEVAWLFEHALCSFMVSSHSESYGWTTLESLQRGCPVVGSKKSGAYNELLGDLANTLGTEYADETLLADVLVKLASLDSKTLSTLKKQLKKRAQMFSAHQFQKQVTEVLTQP